MHLLLVKWIIMVPRLNEVFLSSLKHMPTPKQFCSLNIAASTLYLSTKTLVLKHLSTKTLVLNIAASNLVYILHRGIHVTSAAKTLVLSPFSSPVMVSVIVVCETKTTLVCYGPC
jgi:hypothetical protein